MRDCVPVPDNCPDCNTSWLGDVIPEASREWFGNETHFRREIAHVWNDYAQRYQCPDCKAVFDRWTMRRVEMANGIDILRFEVGKRYGVSLMNEDDGRCEVTIISRTAQTVKLDTGKTRRVRVWRALGNDRIEREVISPLGRYSMAPIITALDLVNEDAE